jgi:hypothetical protein
MNAKLLFGLAVILSVMSPSLRAEAQAEGTPAVSHPMNKVEVAAVKTGDEGRLSFVVRNGGPAPVKVVKDYLPWNAATALKLVVVPVAKGATPVEAMLPIEDPRATVQEIPGNGEVRGDVDVSHFFPHWETLVRQGVLLVWSLNLYDVETGHERRFNGVIEYRAK